MSWNLQRTLNNLEYLLNERTQYMDADNNGTIFEKNITANKFIKTGGGSSLEYLMSDGSTSSGSNVGTGVKNPMIDNLNANNYSLTNVGTINNIDIGIINSDLNIVKEKTQFINSSISLDLVDNLVSTDLPALTTITNNVDMALTTAQNFRVKNTAGNPSFVITGDTTPAITSNANHNFGGNVYAVSNGTSDIGTTAKRFNNLYSQGVNTNSVVVNGSGTGFLKADGTVDNYTYVNQQGGSMFGFLDMRGNCIVDVDNGRESTDLVNKGYVDAGDNSKLNLTGGTISGPLTIQGTLSMGNNTINCGSLKLGGTSTSIMRGNGSTISGTVSQYVMGNGTLLTATYPTFTSGSFSLTIPVGAGGTPTTVNVNYRKISNGIQTMATLIFPITLITNSTTPGWWASGVAIPEDIRPAVATYAPIAIRNGTVFSMGLLWIYAQGNLQISDLAFGNSFINSGAICGINAPQQITYVI